MPAPAAPRVWVIIPLIATLFLLRVQRSDAFSLCKTTAQTNDCLHGTTKDFCGNTVCAKGPGDRCGGPSHVHGRCGEGMHCKCEVCSGCSVHTLDCHFASPTCF